MVDRPRLVLVLVAAAMVAVACGGDVVSDSGVLGEGRVVDPGGSGGGGAGVDVEPGGSGGGGGGGLI